MALEGTRAKHSPRYCKLIIAVNLSKGFIDRVRLDRYQSIPTALDVRLFRIFDVPWLGRKKAAVEDALPTKSLEM